MTYRFAGFRIMFALWAFGYNRCKIIWIDLLPSYVGPLEDTLVCYVSLDLVITLFINHLFRVILRASRFVKYKIQGILTKGYEAIFTNENERL